MKKLYNNKAETLVNYEIDNCLGSYKYLNKLIGGFNSGELVVIAARPACGKTTLALNLACCCCYIDTTIFYSLEMSISELEAKTKKFLDPSADTSKLLIDTDNEINIDTIESDIAVNNAKFVFIDYLNIMKHDNIKTITTKLKAIAKRYNVVIFILAQLNRKAQNTTPDLSMLKDTGSIEQDANQVWFITQDTLIVAKNRKGKVGEIPILNDFKNSFIYEDTQKIDNWKKCYKLFEKYNKVDKISKFFISRKIRKIDEEFYWKYVYRGVDYPTNFVMLIGGNN